MRTLRQALDDGRFAITAELALRTDSRARDLRAQANRFRGLVDALQVADNPLSWVHPSPTAACALLLQDGMDAVPILSCRDRNRIALLSELLGLRALGVTSLVLIRGRRVRHEHERHASTVFDMSGHELIRLAAELNQEEGVRADERFLIGAGARAFRAQEGWSADALAARAAAGAQFLQTQVCYDLDMLTIWTRRLVEAQLTWRYSIIVSVAPLPSADAARWVRRNLAASKIPAALVRRLEQAPDPELEGVRICAEALQQLAELPVVSGVHVMSVGDPELAAAAIEASGLTPWGVRGTATP